MTTYLLDSNILMDFFKQKKEAVDLVTTLLGTGGLAASILSVTELRAGWTHDQARFFLSRFYRLVKVEDINLEIAELAGKYRNEYKSKGLTIPTIDTLIAATAIINNYQLVTRNKRDFPMPEIKFLDF
ncbi:MAG: hypothetical protein A2126_02300 [Candidatus Woykebacteria bacterium GWB1_45_5]|uniref:PIN domain-containing protein n=2 Tax=Microgenomates group TaxID=1794810 RepID=A0A1G1W8H6_9BACT|nr:MAG: putative ribonuclease VapC [Candidatus Woesebacteria bacterium GW2011_GWA1_45_8]OGY23657.1 MAG: hypothetical protein A2126_02300 [Candidatus Woykebacteria bacterium GWB1_45_5]